MIDCEVKVFNAVHEKAAPKCAKGKFVSTVISEEPTAFPAASLIEIDNTTVRNRQSSTPVENYALITYQLEVYAKSKAKCRDVYMTVDDAMIAMNFSRMGGQYVNNATNTTVFRYVARYEAIVDQAGNLYRRP
jgi:hypothetical protein